MIKFTATPSEHNSRLDRFLRKRLPLLGLSGIYGLIRKGAVRVGGKKVRQDYRLQEGDILEIDVNESEFEAQDKPQGQEKIAGLAKTEFFKRNFNVLYEDAYILACNKPAGLVVHSGSGHDHHDNLVDLAAAYILSKEKDLQKTETPVLMHRLDRDTSGVILLAKNKGVVRALHADMRDGKFTKQYIAVCHNRPPEYEGRVSFEMKRSGGSRGGMKMQITTDGEGLASSTAYKILEYQNDLSRLEILLHTGKTHQIRVHMAHLNTPLLGDVRYGDQRLDDKIFKRAPAANRRLYLHSHKLSFPHPQNKKKMTVTTKLPEDFLSFF